MTSLRAGLVEDCQLYSRRLLLDRSRLAIARYSLGDTLEPADIGALESVALILDTVGRVEKQGSIYSLEPDELFWLSAVIGASLTLWPGVPLADHQEKLRKMASALRRSVHSDSKTSSRSLRLVSRFIETLLLRMPPMR